MSLFNKKNRFYPLVFLFFFILVITVFRDLFSSYFEADEWFHLTKYLPLTTKPDGLLTASIYNIFHTEALSGGQHVTPIASSIFFLNVNFFGLHYEPYAFMALFFHTLNSFLVFLFVKIVLRDKLQIRKNIFALISGTFYALSPTAMHVWTGAAPFYGENILSATFVLIFLITFKLAYENKSKKLLYISLFSILCALFSKETSAYILLLFPCLVLLEKRIFSFKFLSILFVSLVVFYTIIRFIVPNFTYLQEKISHKFFNGPPVISQQTVTYVDTGTIVSRDVSIHANLPAELLYRAVTFPIKMMGTIYIPRETVTNIVGLIAPVVYPLPPGASGDLSHNYVSFLYGPGIGVVVYLISLSILLISVILIISLIRNKQIENAKLVATGFLILILSALPLVAVIFQFPRWGYDAYFDSRHYYHAGIGAAILFPFILFSIAQFLSHLLPSKMRATLVSGLIMGFLFLGWLINSINTINTSMENNLKVNGHPRRQVVEQMKQLLPTLPKKAVIHTETDNLGPYGPALPFQTNIPQSLMVAYYDRSPLPDSFYSSFLNEGEGYKYADGRGFGYYASKKSLVNALLANEFFVDDVYSFYYEAEKVKLTDRTARIRDEMRKYIQARKEFSEWKTYQATPSATEKMTFLYPPNTEIVDNPIASTEAKILKDIQINSPQVTTSIKVIRTVPGFDVSETMGIFGKISGADLPTTKKVSFDEYNFNDVLVSRINDHSYYVLKFNDLLVSVINSNADESSTAMTEKVLGSINITK